MENLVKKVIGMEFFEEALGKAKEAFDLAQQKTGEIVNVAKQKYDIASLENKLVKLYTKLGKQAYSYLSKDSQADEAIKATVAEIGQQLEKIQYAKEQLSNLKSKRICPVCAAGVDESAAYCAKCGAKLIFTE